jgi:hypothetical protein
VTGSVFDASEYLAVLGLIFRTTKGLFPFKSVQRVGGYA